MIRTAKWTGYLLSLLALLAVVLLLIVLLTPAGVTLSRELAARFIPSLSLREVSGTLLSSVCVAELDYQTETIAVNARELCIEPKLWRSLELIRISLADLSARSLTITSRPSPAAATDTREIPKLPVTLEVAALRIDELQIDATRIDALTGRLNLDGPVLDSQVALRYQDWRVGMKATGPWSALQVQAQVEVPEPVSVSATLDLTRQQLPYDAQIGVQSLDLNSRALRNAQLRASALSLTGDLSGYRFDLRAAGNDQMFGQFNLVSRGEGDLRGARLSAQLSVNPQVSGLDEVGSMQIDGSLLWLPELAFDLELVADGVSASMAAHQAKLGGRLHLSGDADDVRVDASEVKGVINDLPALGGLKLRWQPQQLDIERADVALGEGRVAFAGSLSTGQLAGLRVDADRLPLSVARMGLRGSVSGEVTVSGSLTDPVFQADLQGDGVGYQAFASQSVSLEASGTRTDMQLTAAVVADAYSANSVLALRAAGEEITADVETLKLRLTPDSGAAVALTLNEPGRVRWQPGSFSVERSCLTGVLIEREGATARLCVALQYPDGTGFVELAELQLAQLPLPAGDLLVDALVTGRMQIDDFTPLRGRAEIRVAELVAHIDNYQRALGTLNGTLQLDNGQAALVLDSEPDQPLQVRGELAAQLAAELTESPVQGKLAVSVDGIRIVEEFLPTALAYELSDLRGELQLAVDVSGELGAPLLDGTLQMKEAGWRNDAVGTEFSNVTMQVLLKDAGSVALSAAGNLGSGGFTLDGELRDLAGSEPLLAADITLDDARAINLPEYSGKLTGKLALEVSSEALKVEGTLRLPSARVQVVELPETAVSASTDTVIVGARVEPVQQIRTTDIDVALGDDVRLQALGLDARLEGALRLREQPGLPPDVRGTLILREGRFKAYGKELQVNRGLLTFSGPIDDPTVDVVASRLIPRESGDVLVLLVLSGTARTIETEVISTPALPEGDALALLLTGRTLSEMTNSEQASMTGTAVTLGLYGASGVTRSIAETLALEEIIVGKDSSGEWEAGAAVRLQHNLYLRYTYGVFSRIGGVLLRYRLTDRVSVQAKSGDSHSIELRYGVE